jgi:hypothetical protein
MRRRQPSPAAFSRNPSDLETYLYRRRVRTIPPVLRERESTTRGLGLPLVLDSLILASTTSSSTSRLRLETNVEGAAYVVEETTRRHDHSHAGFEARGHHLSEDLTCSGIVNPTSTVPKSQRYSTTNLSLRLRASPQGGAA